MKIKLRGIVIGCLTGPMAVAPRDFSWLVRPMKVPDRHLRAQARYFRGGYIMHESRTVGVDVL